jgi:hypothetical protein
MEFLCSFLGPGSDGIVWAGGKSVGLYQGHNPIHVDIDI